MDGEESERGKARNQFDFYCFARSASNWPYITVNFIQISLAPHRTLLNTSSCGFHLSSLRSLFSFSIHWSKKLRNAFVRVESTTVVYCLYWWEASQLTCSHLSGLNLQRELWPILEEIKFLSCATHTMSRQRCEPFNMRTRERHKDLKAEDFSSLQWTQELSAWRTSKQWK